MRAAGAEIGHFLATFFAPEVAPGAAKRLFISSSGSTVLLVAQC